jgi:hypothetical protein
MAVSRGQVQIELQGYVADANTAQTKENFTTKLTAFLVVQKATAIEKSQILDDLENYSEYHSLTV